MSASQALTVGVVGGSGLTGGELCRLLLGHPAVGTILPTSRDDEAFERVHRNLLGSGLRFHSVDDVRRARPDVVFFCTPTGEAMRQAPELLDAGSAVVDLSADFRFRSAETFEAAHGMGHVCPELLTTAAYGVTELFRSAIADTRLVANPGCYVIASLLALLPLVRSRWVGQGTRLSICAVNGTSGAGTKPRRDLHHTFAAANMLPYNLKGHRHRLEIASRLGELVGKALEVDLTTMHGNFARGIVVLVTIPLGPDVSAAGLDRRTLLDLYTEAYGSGHDEEYFVLVNEFEERAASKTAKEYDIYPSVARVMGSNACHLGVDFDDSARAIKVVSVIDNLIKGAAGSAIQNMNVMLGLPERQALTAYGL